MLVGIGKFLYTAKKFCCPLFTDGMAKICLMIPRTKCHPDLEKNILQSEFPFALVVYLMPETVQLENILSLASDFILTPAVANALLIGACTSSTFTLSLTFQVFLSPP